ncbi:unnamed protein product [Rotaria socialis]|uniref:Transposase n=1 Tax=Rotaria socialis TaxID=392032 RepID=A0A820W403_9BILA|nr:unnamed protein product [Rotaria socialis]
MPQHEISRKLKISRHYVQQTIRKFNEFHTVATKPGAGRHSKLTNRQNRAIKLQQDGSLNSDKYIDILDKHLPTAFENFLPHSSHEILLQQDNARPHVSIKTRKIF